MPKGALKSVTKRKQDNLNSEKTKLDTSVEMKEVEQTATSATLEDEGGPSAKHDVENTSVDPSAQAKSKKKNESPPGKPRRVFVLAGTILKKKDAVPKQIDNTTTPQDEGKKANETENTKDDKVDTEPGSEPKDEERSLIDKSVKRNSFGDDEHPYEDPSLVVNNSKTPLQQQQQGKPLIALQQPKKQSEMKRSLERSPSPGLMDSKKSNESIKVTVKPTKNRPSVMVEHSIPRSIFAILVALLLSLIVFLALHFLLHCHPVLSVVLAIFVFFLIFMVLGFLDIGRMKCLILLFLPSVCSNGGKSALYVLLLYFVIKGPLCNTIGNIKSVRHSIMCVNNEQFRHNIGQTFDTAQRCVDAYWGNYTNTNKSRRELSCLKKTCITTKEKLQQDCDSETPRISTKLCNMTEDLMCVKLNQSNIPRNLDEKCVLPMGIKPPCQKEFDKILEILGRETDENHCGFLEIIGMFLPLLIFLVFYEAYSYQKNYQTYNGFHNYFLTGHFQCIDQSRSSCDREAVLPLRKVELRQHVRPSTLCQTTDGEKNLICRSLQIYLAVLLIVLFLILADLYLFRIFNVEKQNEPQGDVQTPVLFKHNNVTILVDMTKKLTSISNNTNSKKINNNNNSSVDNNQTNKQSSNLTTSNMSSQVLQKVEDVCSVKVEPPGVISKVAIPTLLILILLVIFIHPYIIRLQWYICSRFYNEREKERVFYLYNKILEDRIHLVENCRKRMKCYHREMNTLNALEPTRILANQSKWLSKIFRFFHIDLRKCIICNDSERGAFKICHGADCSGVYCLACSFDIDKKCLYCDTKLKKSLSKRQPDDKDVSSKESLV